MIHPELVTLVPLLARLTPPSSWAELGNATSVLNGLFSSIAILIGLMAIYKQGRQIEKSINEQRISNQLTAKIAYLEYLRGEMNRLEEDIQRLRRSEKYDKNLFDNMSRKESEHLSTSKRIIEEIDKYYEKFHETWCFAIGPYVFGCCCYATAWPNLDSGEC